MCLGFLVLFEKNTLQRSYSWVLATSNSPNYIGFLDVNAQKWRFVINSTNGNTGIGTTNPSQKLEVSGSVKIGNGGDTATPGTIRYNADTDKFQGYIG